MLCKLEISFYYAIVIKIRNNNKIPESLFLNKPNKRNVFKWVIYRIQNYPLKLNLLLNQSQGMENVRNG